MMSVLVSKNVLAENWGTKDYIQQYEKEMKALDGSMQNSFSSFSQDITATEGDRNKNSKSKEKVKNTIPYYDSQAKEQDLSEKNLRKRGHESQMTAGIAKDDDIKAVQDSSVKGERSAIKFRQESYLRKHRYKEGDLKDVTDQNIPNKGDIGIDIAEVIENPLIGLNKGNEQGGLDTACSVSDSENTTVKPKLEPYEVEIDDVREKESEHECQEDDDRLFQCDRILKNIDCASKSDCGYNAGGIEEGSVDTGIDWDYTYPYLRLGSKTPETSNEEDWHFRCGSHTCCDKRHRSARFIIRDLNDVKKFILHKISYDDYAQVKINGVTVHNTLGGSYLDITRRYWGSDRDGDNDRIISSGVGSGPCWRLYPGNGFDHYDYVGKDLRQYLKEGVNEIEIELVFAQLGQVNVVFEAEQYCCKEWSDKWESDCPVD